jgi:predicted peroxiredoxin
MADSLALMVASGGSEAMDMALDLLEAAAAMEMDSHFYITGAAIAWVAPAADPDRAAPWASEEARAEVARRLRDVKEDGQLTVYVCSRAMATHGVARERLSDAVDMPAGFAYFLNVASESTVTLNL